MSATLKTQNSMTLYEWRQINKEFYISFTIKSLIRIQIPKCTHGRHMYYLYSTKKLYLPRHFSHFSNSWMRGQLLFQDFHDRFTDSITSLENPGISWQCIINRHPVTPHTFLRWPFEDHLAKDCRNELHIR